MSYHQLPSIAPEDAGIHPADILDFLSRIEKNRLHLHSFLMLKGEAVFAQGSYRPCSPRDVHMLFSLSKSFTSTAVGFAVQEGRLTLSDKVVDFFREELADKEVSQNMKRMTVRHLLTMNTGQTEPEDELFQDPRADWCLRFLTSPVEKEPGSWFLYNTRATYMLAAILQKRTGEDLMDYLRPRLFEPLGFSENIWWEHSPQNICAGGFGLNITTEDLARFGIFLKNRGSYGGRQLLTEKWFEEATVRWSDSSNTWAGENACGYGYQFWMCHIPGSYRGDGAFGQYCAVMPKEDLLFISTAGELDMQKILDAFWDTVYRGYAEHQAGRRDLSRYAVAPYRDRLEARLRDLTLPAYYEESCRPEPLIRLPREAVGKTYLLEDNVLHIVSIRLTQAAGPDGCCLLELRHGNCRSTLSFCAQRWTAGTLYLDPDCVELQKGVFRAGLFSKCFVRGCTDQGTLYLDMLFHETSFQDTWKIAFSPDGISLDIKRNTGFVPADVHVKGLPEKS